MSAHLPPASQDPQYPDDGSYDDVPAGLSLVGSRGRAHKKRGHYEDSSHQALGRHVLREEEKRHAQHQRRIARVDDRGQPGPQLLQGEEKHGVRDGDADHPGARHQKPPLEGNFGKKGLRDD